jgi:hypothetical protein
MSTLFVLQISFIKVFSQIIFLIFKNSRNGEITTLVLFLSLRVTGIIPKVYKSVCGFSLSHPPTRL